MTAHTDDRGLATVAGLCDGSIGLEVSKRGYYKSGKTLSFKTVVDGRWQPWDELHEIQLKKVVQPVPMYAKKFGEGRGKKVPEFGVPVGLDLLKGDWVSPHGKGEVADFIVKIEARTVSYEDFDGTMTLTFSNPDDGMQSVYAEPYQGSYLRLPRTAPQSGYTGPLVRRRYARPGELIHVERRDDQNYFFRVRTKKDEDGRIVSALYGKIHGEIEWWEEGSVRFVYYVNPEPNSRNVEFDPRRNLMKGLASFETVQDP